MARNLPRTMRAVGLYKYLPVSDPNSLVDVEVNLPTLQKKDVLIQLPCFTVVVHNGEEANIFRPGDEVFFAGDFRRNGHNSQYAAVDQILIGPKPKSLTFEEAAALPIISITAFETLIDRMQISEKDKGKTLLIINSAGGVGSMASQLAKHLGLKVIGTASRPETAAFSRDFGADVVLDHTKDLIPQLEANGYGGGVEYILVNHDPYPYWDTLTKAIKTQGKITLIVDSSGGLSTVALRDKSVTLITHAMYTRTKYDTEDRIRQHEILKEVSKLVDSGVLKCNLTKTLSPINAANMREAHRLIEEKRMIGKLVLTGF